MVKKLKLNLGCGNDKKEGYLNCDISKDVRPDKIVDLEKKLPFKDNSVDEIYAKMVIEHINNLDLLFNEMYRICKNKAKILIRVPFFSSYHNFSDPTHVRQFNHLTLNKFNLNERFLIKSRFHFGEAVMVK